MAKRIIVLTFWSPQGTFGATYADTLREAVETIRVYEADGYRLADIREQEGGFAC